MGTKVLKGVFWIVGMLLVAILLYNLFFRGGIGGDNAITFLCRNIEAPIAESYYETTLYPSVNSNSSATSGLGITVGDSTNFDADEVDDASVVADYSTGWY